MTQTRNAAPPAPGVSGYRELCQKGDEENYLLDKYVFRVFSIYFTILFIKLGIRPNQTTLLSLFASLGSLYFLLHNEPWMLLTGGGLIFLYHLLDHVDGELARYYIKKGEQKPSVSGQFYDVLVHSFSANLMLLFMSVGLFSLYGHAWIVLAGVAAFMGASGFPRFVAGRILLQKVARDRRSPMEDPRVVEVLDVLEWKEAQVAAVQSGALGRRKLKKLVVELIGYPGMLFLLMGALLVDALLPGLGGWFALEANARLIVVISAAAVGVLKMIYLTIKMGRLLQPIS